MTCHCGENPKLHGGPPFWWECPRCKCGSKCLNDIKAATDSWKAAQKWIIDEEKNGDHTRRRT